MLAMSIAAFVESCLGAEGGEGGGISRNMGGGGGGTMEGDAASRANAAAHGGSQRSRSAAADLDPLHALHVAADDAVLTWCVLPRLLRSGGGAARGALNAQPACRRALFLRRLRAMRWVETRTLHGFMTSMQRAAGEVSLSFLVKVRTPRTPSVRLLTRPADSLRAPFAPTARDLQQFHIARRSRAAALAELHGPCDHDHVRARRRRVVRTWPPAVAAAGACVDLFTLTALLPGLHFRRFYYSKSLNCCIEIRTLLDDNSGGAVCPPTLFTEPCREFVGNCGDTEDQ